MQRSLKIGAGHPASRRSSGTCRRAACRCRSFRCSKLRPACRRCGRMVRLGKGRRSRSCPRERRGRRNSGSNRFPAGRASPRTGCPEPARNGRRNRRRRWPGRKPSGRTRTDSRPGRRCRRCRRKTSQGSPYANPARSSRPPPAGRANPPRPQARPRARPGGNLPAPLPASADRTVHAPSSRSLLAASSPRRARRSLHRTRESVARFLGTIRAMAVAGRSSAASRREPPAISQMRIDRESGRSTNDQLSKPPIVER
jgi:hypothetical protein